MSNLRRVVWSQGMFLTPQHFQTQDISLENTLHSRFAASCFANWGVTDLAIDEQSLANGLFTFRRCRGVLPDGLVFDIPDTDEAPAGRPIADHFAPALSGLDVYLAIPERRPKGKNVTQRASLPDSNMQATTRYVTSEVDVPDDTGLDEQKTIQIGSRNFSILFGDQNLDGYTTLRVARVVRNEVNVYALDPSFVAPCLNISSSPFLMMLVRRQLEHLITKRNSIEGSRREKGRDLVDFTAGDPANFWMLYIVNSYIPELNHIWSVRRGHPEALFVRMLQLAGALAVFSLSAAAHNLPDYDHDNLGVCFSALDEKIYDLVETIIQSKCFSVPLKLTERQIWSGTVPDEKYFQDSQCYLAINAKIGIDELIKKTPQLVKVSASEDIQNLIRHALPGITLRHLPTVPPSVTFKIGNQYFSLNQTGRLWDGLVRTRAVSIFVPQEIADPQLEFLIVSK